MLEYDSERKGASIRDQNVKVRHMDRSKRRPF